VSQDFGGPRPRELWGQTLPKVPRILSEADFAEPGYELRLRDAEPGTCSLIIAHTNLYGTTPAEDDHGARDFLKMMLGVAEEFPEVTVGLLSRDDAGDLARWLQFEPGSRPQANGVISTAGQTIVYYDHETPESLRLWFRGILLRIGIRACVSKDDLAVRLAYELAEPERYSFSEARWSTPRFRNRSYEAAKQALDTLTEKWAPGIP
jgi:hypothetical protein